MPDMIFSAQWFNLNIYALKYIDIDVIDVEEGVEILLLSFRKAQRFPKVPWLTRAEPRWRSGLLIEKAICKGCHRWLEIKAEPLTWKNAHSDLCFPATFDSMFFMNLSQKRLFGGKNTVMDPGGYDKQRKLQTSACLGEHSRFWRISKMQLQMFSGLYF